jgi:hypothetical protein
MVHEDPEMAWAGGRTATAAAGSLITWLATKARPTMADGVLPTLRLIAIRMACRKSGCGGWIDTLLSIG